MLKYEWRTIFIPLASCQSTFLESPHQLQMLTCLGNPVDWTNERQLAFCGSVVILVGEDLFQKLCAALSSMKIVPWTWFVVQVQLHAPGLLAYWNHS